jgi:hypothetical protein
VGVPHKKTDLYVLRAEALSQSDEVLNAFKGARTLKDQILALDNILKALASISDPSQLAPICAALDDSARKNAKLHTGEAVQLLVARDEIASKFPNLARPADAPSISAILREENARLSDLLGELPMSKLKKAILALPDAYSDHWATRAIQLFMRGNGKLAPEAARLLIE